ncbi:transposase, IS5 family [Methanolobus vulcani]|jgi:hypothetical protein|uniref:Transposase, IS5 family n=1 Tax=Methanolobus vulcani TaxID=38026 RepID=A0A7Z7AVU3_9EURY|nr:hypothetical protein [Methanolobus vulcani]SDF63644.1 transposase, IS5 family [Methanolobus vulcani]
MNKSSIVSNLTDFALYGEYKRLQSIDQKIAEIESLIDWKTFRLILELINSNKTALYGRPEADVIVMVKIRVLRQ